MNLEMKASEQSVLWKILDNPLLSSALIATLFSALVIGVFNLSTGAAYILFNSGLALILGWVALSAYIHRFQKKDILAVMTMFAMTYGLAQYRHVFFEGQAVVQLDNPEVTVTGGLFGDSFYMTVPDKAKVNQAAIKISSPYIITARTSEGWFVKRFICNDPEITPDCGFEI